MTDFEEKALFGVALLVGGYVLYKEAAKLIANVVPPVVKEGAQAAGTLATETAHAVAHPLDAFGVSPAATATGTAYWQPTTPQENPQDVVSNNDLGINFNYF